MYMWSSSGQRRECGGQRALTRQRLDEVPTAKLQEDLGVETRAKRVAHMCGWCIVLSR